jgi:hypothetical protein
VARVLHEIAEKPELAVGERRAHAADPHLAVRQVELEPPRPEDAPSLERLLEMHAHAGEQLLEREGLLDVVAGAELEGLELGRDVASRRHHDHRQLRPFPLDALEHGEAVQLGKDEVKEDEVVPLLEGTFDRVRPRPGPVHDHPVRTQPAGEEVENSSLVFDDEDAPDHAPPRSLPEVFSRSLRTPVKRG